jgi:sensor histidine kinase YesM
METLVPNFVLQPLVENAVMHGVSKVQGEGRIELRARRNGDDVVITVRDNGPGFDPNAPTPERTEPSASGGGVGLGNTRARLQQLYGKAQRLSLVRAPEGGTIAEIVLPYHPGEDLHAVGAPATA